MALKRTSDGSVDLRTKQGKAIAARMAKARAARSKSKTTKSTGTKLKRTQSGKVDKRTKEGKAIAARIAKARRAKNSLSNRLKRLFS